MFSCCSGGIGHKLWEGKCIEITPLLYSFVKEFWPSICSSIHQELFSQLQYCFTWHCQITPEKLQSVLSAAAAQLISGSITTSTKLSIELQWLPINYHIKYKMWLCTYCCLHCMAFTVWPQTTSFDYGIIHANFLSLLASFMLETLVTSTFQQQELNDMVQRVLQLCLE